MRKYLRIIHSGIFLRLMAIFIAILIILYAMGIVLVYTINEQMRVDAEATHSRMKAVLNNLEFEVSHMLGMVQDHIIYNKSLMLAVNFPNMTPYEKIDEIRDLQDILGFTKNRSTYIKDIKCNIYGMERAIGMTGKIDEIDYDAIATMRRTQSMGGGSMLSYEGELHVFIQYPAASKNPQSVLFSLDMLLDKDKIHANIVESLADGAEYSLVFHNSKGAFTMAGNPPVDMEGDRLEYNVITDNSEERLLGITVWIPDENHGLDTALPVVLSIITIVILAIAFLYSRWLMEVVDVSVEQETLVRNAHIQQLETQINPHFLYNSLNLLNCILHLGDLETAVEYTALLGKYYRYITRNDGKEIALSSEIEHARAYAQIQSRRYDGRIEVNLPETPPLDDIAVPRMIIQPILENAFEHGVGDMEKGGTVHMTYALTKDTLCITVEDSGKGLSEAQSAYLVKSMFEPNPDATGIVNIGRRLIMNFGADYAPRFERSELGGLKVTIRIPVDDTAARDEQAAVKSTQKKTWIHAKRSKKGDAGKEN